MPTILLRGAEADRDRARDTDGDPRAAGKNQPLTLSGSVPSHLGVPLARPDGSRGCQPFSGCLGQGENSGPAAGSELTAVMRAAGQTPPVTAQWPYLPLLNPPFPPNVKYPSG